ncbi:uncharacterized protein LOC115622513 [Scaptodrosophila lebanonensis]|uniref:Uncharacterized protein LOC115622513 n=1 Tax=Drosophila lebanonensis TaxID=7225 RepID=A0A6J2TBI3_DROLE|nr:uncharacterized protein LOC115622513 [Scaptodrosophila lebanonensis]
MDIPSSGAIFTLGKSHLAENTQSYFYIKNDPVKRLISGPHQSAVICESGRLFVWGENQYGQLGIGGHSGKSSSNSSNNNNSSTANGDIVTKPTCVKALKSLGLKIGDAAFGNNWAVILTHSNEIFFTGRNIFPEDTHVAQHFTNATVEGEPCAIIRKPFRLEEFDDYLSTNEDTHNFLSVQTGNEHFAVLTSNGRLIGCGSNEQQQLGELEVDYDGHPVEIQLDAPIQQFTCGPESTLVLTASGNLFLTGRLNEFVFPKFTELQKNLSQSEQIIFMHISKTSEIYIVTNVGGIYRSFESVRNKSLVFQRFYDYDSEENGPIWKLLKGFSFYAVLTKANKFFTTFSESGHHLKTFREISKFKNLRLLDIAVGEQHILVQGVPRSTTLSATMGPGGEHRFMSQSFVLQPPDLNGNAERSSSGRVLSKQKVVDEEIEKSEGTMPETTMESVSKKQTTGDEKTEEKETAISNKSELTDINGNGEKAMEENVQPITVEETQSPTAPQLHDIEVGENADSAGTQKGDQKEEHEKLEKAPEIVETPKQEEAPPKSMESVPPAASPVQLKPKGSPTDSTHSRKSARSAHFDPATMSEKSETHTEKFVRPRTPYPESSNSSTPQTIKKTPMRNFSYESAMDHDHLERTSPELMDSLETVEENPTAESDKKEKHIIEAVISGPTPPTEEDEELAVEITTTKDALDSSKVVNEIRFINNGIDVTANVEEQLPDTSLENSVEEIEAEVEQTLQEVEEHVERLVQTSENVADKIETKALEARDEIQMAIRKAGTGTLGAFDVVKNGAKRIAAGARDAVDAVGDNAKFMAGEAREAVNAVGDNAKRIAGGARDAVDAAGENAKRMASDAVQAVGQASNNAVNAVGQVGSNAAKAAADTKESMGKAMGSMANKISNEMHGAKENISSLFQIKAAKEAGTTAPESTPRSSEDDDNDKEGAPKTTTTIGSVEEEDERTTASVNSNHTSAGGGNGNQFEPNSNNTQPFVDSLDAVVERSKKAMQDDLRAMEQLAQSRANSVVPRSEQQAEQSKGLMRQFLDGMRLSCRNEKSIQIEDDQQQQQPHYNKNKVNSELSLHNGHNGDQQSSRVCTIL